MVLLHKLGRWCAYALLLVAPGSFVVLPALWLVRSLTVQAARRRQSAAGRAWHPM